MNVIQFGRYYQNGTTEKEGLEWLVLDEDEETIFVVSQKAITSRCFDEDGRVWKDSEIREWLNKRFCNEAFKEHERCCIKITDVQTFDAYGFPYCCTQDELFLLSFKEVEKYFPDPASRIQEKSVWAQDALEEKDTNRWWLRDAGAYNSAGLMVLEDGTYDSMGGTQNICGIRPAMRLIKNYTDYVTPEIPILEGQLSMFNKGK